MNPRDALAMIGAGGRRFPTSTPLQRCNSIEDLRQLAAARTPRPVFDYVDGGADEELSLRRNTEAFHAWELEPIGPGDVSILETRVTLLDAECELPLICGPTGYTRMIHQSGELAVARAAAKAGLPYALSTVASSSIETVAGSNHPSLWFQLYIWRDREMTRSLVARAWAAGYRVLEVSIDVAVSGFRTRDEHNGLTIPPRLTARALAGIAAHPAYWLGVLRNPPITFANAPPDIETSGGLTIEDMSSQFDPRVGWDDIVELRSQWPGKLVVKGPLNAASAERAIASGADGVHLSNHGGRQLDRSVPPIELVGEVRAAIGRQPTIIIDSGIRHGTDIAIALACGADAGAIGRVYLYGLMAGGQPGVERALELLSTQFRRTLALLGVSSVAELKAHGGTLLRRRAGR